MIKLAVTGKGGVGKTTISALLSTALARQAYDVFALDADPNPTLLACLGHPRPDTVAPLVDLADLIEERTGAKPGSIGAMFRLNPFVADIPEVYAQSIAGVRVLVAGGVKKGGAGCYCPENSLVRALVSHLLLDEKVALVVDMEAGLEHLSRGTVDSVDRLLVVVEPSRSSVETTRRIQRMAGDIGLRRVLAVGSKVRGPEDEVFLREALGGLSFAGCVPYDARIGDAERAGRAPYGASPEVDAAVDGIVQQLQR